MSRKNDIQRADGSKRIKKLSSKENNCIIDLEQLKKRDEGKCLLKITNSISIIVDKENCNKAYAEAYLSKIQNMEKVRIEQATQYKSRI